MVGGKKLGSVELPESPKHNIYFCFGLNKLSYLYTLFSVVRDHWLDVKFHWLVVRFH